MYDLVFYVSEFSIDGVGADTVGFGGAKLFGPGIVDGTDSLCWWIETTPSADSDTLCIDSAYYPPGGEWLWYITPGDNVIPDWGGPYCFLVWECCVGNRGNADGQGGINVADLTYLVSYLFNGGLAPPCYEEGNVDGEGGINVADLTYLVDYLFFNGPAPPLCP